MKITTLLMIVGCLHISAASLSQTVSVKANKWSITQVFDAIRQQTDYQVIYSDELIDPAFKVSLTASRMPLETFLDKVLKPLSLSYQVKESTILIGLAPQMVAPTIQEVRDIKFQQRTITGKVTDEQGSPLEGVTVRVKGTTIAVATVHDGMYEVRTNGNSPFITFSLMGYETVGVNVGNRTRIDISLKPIISDLDEVVVVGYGEQKKANLTGAVASLSFDGLENIPQASTVNALSGRMPGLTVVQGGGQPGEDAGELTVRGISSLNGSSEPLVIIDGAQATVQDLSNLNPQDIDNVSVLKDAASAAIYGARGGNGVLLVTTRMPKTNKPSIRFNAYTGLQQATYLPKFVESWQWLVLMNRATGSPEDSRLAAIDSLRAGLYSDNLANTKWFDEIFHTAPISDYTVSISGGNNGSPYQLSVGYMDQQGIMKGTDAERFTLRGKVESKINKSITARLNTWGYLTKKHSPYQPINSILTDASRNPILPVRYANGDWAVFSPYVNNNVGIANPLLRTAIGDKNDETNQINVQPAIDIRLLKGLTWQTSFTYSTNFYGAERYNPTYSYNNSLGVESYYNLISELENVSRNNKQSQLQSTINFNRQFKKAHQVSALVGYEFLDKNVKVFRAYGQEIPSNLVPVLDNAVANLSNSGNKSGYRLQSFFGRVNYGYKGRYLFEGNLRYDGSSVVNGNYRTSPSASVGWVISSEKFFGNGWGLIDFLKLRIGYGSLGNDRGIGNYTFLQTLKLNNFYEIGGALQTTAAITALANPAINWERSTSENVGFDMALFQNKLNITADLYRRTTDGILFRVPTPLSFGNVQAPVLNLAEVSNKGVELNVNYRQSHGDFNYRLAANFSYNQNNVENLNGQRVISGGNGRGNTLIQEGSSVDSWFGFVVDGLYTQEDMDNEYPKFNEKATVVGSLKLVDINNDGRIDESDRTIIGNGNVPYTFGLSTNFSYKNVSLSFLGQGIAGKDIYIYDQGNRPGNDGTTNFWAEWWERSYHSELNPEGDWPIMKRGSPEVAASSSFWIANASYLRIKNVELGYTLPTNWLQKLSVQKTYVYVAGQNLLTFSTVPKNLDPERSNFQRGNASYPQTRLYTFGVNIQF